MKNNLNQITMAVIVAGLFNFNAIATEPSAPMAPRLDPMTDMSVAQRVALDQNKMAKHRALYASYFKQAYQTYPVLPPGILETLAYVGSRWEHRLPQADSPSHHNMPQSIGLFGLYDSNKAGFGNTLTMVASHANIDKSELINHVESYIMATAAYLAAELLKQAQSGHTLESAKPLLIKMSGLPVSDNNISRYAINSYLYDLYSIIQKGHDANGIQISPRDIQWQQVFNAKELQLLRAPGLVIDAENDNIHLKGEQYINSEKASTQRTADYGPALWYASPNYSSRSGTAISHVAIHTTQGSYSGAISWLANPAAGASAHYVIRSSDGQVTQMVLDTNKAWHARTANPYSIGIEHEGYVNSSSWYTEAQYNSSADLTQHMCSQHSVDCNDAYAGAAHSTVTELSPSYTVKGHQHFPDQSHTDPGIYWDWAGYHNRLNGSGGSPTVTILDDFETGEGSFDLYPTYSGSTSGIASSSTAVQTSSIAYNGGYSEQLKLIDDPSSSSNWTVRFLSNGGSSSANTNLTVNNGKVGFWVYSGGSGLTAAIGIDDNDGTERSVSKTIPANQWTFLEWALDDSSQWNAWYLGNGALSATQVSIDAIWFFRNQTAYNVYLYIDDVQYSVN